VHLHGVHPDETVRPADRGPSGAQVVQGERWYLPSAVPGVPVRPQGSERDQEVEVRTPSIFLFAARVEQGDPGELAGRNVVVEAPPGDPAADHLPGCLA
jgi:hypothetical protein